MQHLRPTAATQRYDHHQRTFSEVFGHGFNTKLSSAGALGVRAAHSRPRRLMAWAGLLHNTAACRRLSSSPCMHTCRLWPPTAGLVYKHYGRDIVAAAMGLPADHADVEVREPLLQGWALGCWGCSGCQLCAAAACCCCLVREWRLLAWLLP